MNPNLGTVSENIELGEFFSYIYGDTEGIAYLAVKSPLSEQHNFTQYFYDYPAELPKMIDTVLQRREQFEVYYAPALFVSKTANQPGGKENVKGANVYWVEFDGTIPDFLPGIPSPTLKVKSSIDGHEHWYWRSDSFIEVKDLERVNRALTYLLGADSSGWDANQILRPINTVNHKRKAPVHLIEQTTDTINLSDFGGLPEPPPPVDAPVPDQIPDCTDVISRYQIPEVVWLLFKNGRPEGQRSEGLMALGYYLAELGMSNEEIFSMILNADIRWGKFKDRQDQLQRLAEIVTVARVKYPLKTSDESEELPSLEGLGLVSFLKTEYNFEWIVDGWLQQNGYFLLTGPSGVGKTQFSLNAGMNIALGLNFLEREIVKPMRTGFMSLEMGGPDLQFFLQKQASTYSPEQLVMLESNFVIAPVGEPIYMDTVTGQAQIEKWIVDNELEGVIIDSLVSSMAGDVSAEGPSKSIMAWVDHIRQKYGIFIWFIHHHRKATGDNKKPNKLQDVYGSMVLTARATSVVCLWDLGIMNTLQCIPLKMRLSPDKDPFNVYRGADLKFIKKGEGITIMPQKKSEAEIETTQEEFDGLQDINLNAGPGQPL